MNKVKLRGTGNERFFRFRVALLKNGARGKLLTVCADFVLSEMDDEQTKGVPRMRHHPMPLIKAVHEMFLSFIRTRDTFPLYPTGPALKAAGFPKPRGGHSRREQFKNWAERMDIRYDLETRTEVLIYRRTGKIILPVEHFEKTVRQVHCEGHSDWKKTMELVSYI